MSDDAVMTLDMVRDEFRKRKRAAKEPRLPQHPSSWWGLTREYQGLSLGAIVLYGDRELRVRRIDPLSERPFTLVDPRLGQTTFDVYRDEIELINQGNGFLHSRKSSDT